MSRASALYQSFHLLHTPLFLTASWQGRRIYIEIRCSRSLAMGSVRMTLQGRLWLSCCFHHLLRCPSVASFQAAKVKMKFTNYALADEAPKSQGIPTKLTLNLLAPHQAIFTKKEVDQVIFKVRGLFHNRAVDMTACSFVGRPSITGPSANLRTVCCR